MNQIIIKEITTAAPEYSSSLELRNTVLRKPLGLDISQDDLSMEDQAVHIIAIKDDQVIGTLFLLKTEPNTYQMKQVAVHPNYQGQSIGKKLMEAADKWALENSADKIWLHARQNAWTFYERNGYRYISEPYLQVGIVHKTMEKKFDIQ